MDQLRELYFNGRHKNLTIWVFNNYMIHNIPDYVFTVHSIQSLDLGYNKLTYIPDTISNLINLTRLNFSGNRIYTIPESHETNQINPSIPKFQSNREYPRFY